MTETETLFSEILNCERLSLYFNKDVVIGRDAGFFVARALKRRISGEPLEYILGKTEFLGLEFKVDKNVLIPRPETEILVETVLEMVTRTPGHKDKRILDLGTGSGCIAVSLANFLPKIRITASDISLKALEVARGNAVLNKVDDRIEFMRSDLFDALRLETRAARAESNTFDLIITNPPYIAAGEIDNLQPEVKCQPRIALEAGVDGLDYYRSIIAQAPEFLKPGGLLAMEMGFGQKDKIENIFRESGIFNVIKTYKDYSNIDRVIIAQLV
ncbi:MAG: peptide chain release factor N(5)-glutamine methyltransferase [Candidatus Omnitrophota bacterium]|nr:peptide chain release factor N(5)-glutamine methyltransferase [Candidatus Omnitrophota bacterium]MBU1928875.1 peptide chain release factor N(5)-glutamine methyltransferase [Candidatus Omnitrophota bacterium]MBU2034485.1 peptide chain release factor N(5)-glutamine methyltransferase [Candidatus Omnitrophota bacterium]MBU2221495.1 peptide chain release factor N(5)-glutamine methyltransferase [Candidatus Omnitrophota bacterium]